MRGTLLDFFDDVYAAPDEFLVFDDGLPRVVFAWIQVRALEHLQRLDGPVIFASNRLSHLDTPAILMALPPRWRCRAAPAMAKGFFDPHFHPERHTWRKVITPRAAYYLATLFFNAFPIPRREAGMRETLRYIGDLVSDGFSILIFPEGQISHHADILPFQPGVRLLAKQVEDAIKRFDAHARTSELKRPARVVQRLQNHAR